ncbi:MAG: type II toxin-antitoxin system prevent-host-death family antitoxin [Candidatus Nanopelagicales bacterium]|nr:type II toxin-antitoxin system prevent-host-death family antitoxin [Candidatus Nanopelagicales bacterium]
MNEVSVRDLRNYGGQILNRVEGGETMTITRDGSPVALLTPFPQPRLSAAALLESWKNIPSIDAKSLRRDLDQVLDPSLDSNLGMKP